MLRPFILLALSCLSLQAAEPPIAIAIHGGAGSIRADKLPERVASLYEVRLRTVVEAGHAVLRNGGSSVDAVLTCITMMEDDPVFNAGRGAVLTSAGTVELDASIMLGDGRRAGAVAATSRIRHPIRAAYAVMEDSPHVLLVGEGADAFAANQGLETVSNDWFIVPWRRKQQDEQQGGDGAGGPWSSLGTVGCVALDSAGHLAAGTSTGGLAGKLPGRVGDSPLIGAGTYAEDGACAVSASGHGESFIRTLAAYRIVADVRSGVPAEHAAESALAQVEECGGDGGVIIVDAAGNVEVSFSTDGMFRAWVDGDGGTEVRMFADEEEEDQRQ